MILFVTAGIGGRADHRTCPARFATGMSIRPGDDNPRIREQGNDPASSYQLTTACGRTLAGTLGAAPLVTVGRNRPPEATLLCWGCWSCPSEASDSSSVSRKPERADETWPGPRISYFAATRARPAAARGHVRGWGRHGLSAQMRLMVLSRVLLFFSLLHECPRKPRFCRAATGYERFPSSLVRRLVRAEGKKDCFPSP